MAPQINDFRELLREPLHRQLKGVRRSLHQHAEPGWCEVNSAARVAEALEALGWEVRLGADVVNAEARMGLPSQEILDLYFQYAVDKGISLEMAGKLRNGFTGVVGLLKGRRAGPVTAFRFDLDANYGPEASDVGHYPVREGFASVHPGVHHNCGHDGHTSMGLGLARKLSESKDEVAGEVRLVFQPAEEGLRGARSMVAAGVLRDVDFFVGCHLGVQALQLGEIISGYDNILGSIKFDVDFYGRGAHAAISPHIGRNAIMAACAAALNLMALPRHGDGDTRVNIGMISGGESRNTIPAHARMSIELRADKVEVLEFLNESADRILRGSALANDLTFTAQRVGESCSASSDRELSDVIALAAREVAGVTTIRGHTHFKGSDDAAEMMRVVQRHGGKAVYFGIGTELGAVHHNPHFDFNERALELGVETLSAVAQKLWGM